MLGFRSTSAGGLALTMASLTVLAACTSNSNSGPSPASSVRRKSGGDDNLGDRTRQEPGLDFPCRSVGL